MKFSTEIVCYFSFWFFRFFFLSNSLFSQSFSSLRRNKFVSKTLKHFSLGISAHDLCVHFDSCVVRQRIVMMFAKHDNNYWVLKSSTECVCLSLCVCRRVCDERQNETTELILFIIPVAFGDRYLQQELFSLSTRILSTVLWAYEWTQTRMNKKKKNEL